MLSILKDTISNFEAIDEYQMDYIFALYILSKFKEKEALPYVLELSSLPDKWPEELLGDCITESLARFIVSTFNDDISAIKKIIENPTLNEWSRNAALKSLLGLVAIDKLTRDALIEYLRSLFHSPLTVNENFVTHLVLSALDIYPEELLEEINKAFEEDNMDTFFINKAQLNSVLAMGKEECLNTHVYNDRFHLPIDDVEADMLWMSAFSRKNDYSLNNDELEFKTAKPLMRSKPKIGRNEPCYCGSGVKFKKCCLN